MQDCKHCVHREANTSQRLLAGVERAFEPATGDAQFYRALLLHSQSTQLLNFMLVLHCTAFAASIKSLLAVQKGGLLQLRCAPCSLVKHESVQCIVTTTMK